jgi:hypothetical protein
MRAAPLGLAVVLAACAGCTGGQPPATQHSTAPASVKPMVVKPAVTVSPMTDISSGCAGGGSEAEEATAAPGYVYATWIGCGGIGFASSADSGRHFGRPVTVPGSAGRSWDPAIATGPDGTVYVSYMHADGVLGAAGTSMYPSVAVSPDHGTSFTVHVVRPPAPGNWGDRDFIAAGPAGHLYLTWDYGPSAREVRLLCSKAGSCAYSAGDFNVVMQTSADGGQTWRPIAHVEPGFPLGGGYSGAVVLGRQGQVDVLYASHPTATSTLAVRPGYEYFSSSADGVHWPASPRRLSPDSGSLSLREWWVDGDISTDAAGNLYATWDTQTGAADIGWLSYSTDGGGTWSAPIRVTPDTDGAPHITESAGGPAGVAYVAWQTSAPAAGYTTYLRPFAIKTGWLAPAVTVSAAAGNPGIWPGDTFGITQLPGPGTRISVIWGSAVPPGKRSGIYASVVTLST